MSMKLLIDIPEEFEQHFRADRFEDSLHRLSADAHLLAGNYEQETAVMLIEAFKTAVPVPGHGRLIDADALAEHKFVCIPHVSIDGKDAGTAYRLGWNTAIEAVMENAETIIGGE